MATEDICRYDPAHTAEGVPAAVVVAVTRAGDVPCCFDCAYLAHRARIRETTVAELKAGACTIAAAALMLLIGIQLLYVITGSIAVYGSVRKYA